MNQRDFEPLRIASEWHDGQRSALYAYSSTDQIPTETFKGKLINEIERAIKQAYEMGLEDSIWDLEQLLMHVEEQHPDQFPGDEMHEAADEEEATKDSDDSDWKPGKILPKPEKKFQWEGDGMTCEACGGMTSEGPCECAMAEAEGLDEVELGWLKQAASKVKDVAMTDIGGPQGVLTPAGRATAHGRPKADPGDDFKAWQKKRAMRNESTLRQAVRSIVAEMKLSVAGPNPFGFGGAEEMDDEDIAHFVLSKKDASKDVPAPPKSGVKAKAKPAKRKSKKAG